MTDHAAGWWLDAVKLEERRGELLSAFDLAQRGLAEHPDDLWLKHRAVLALARAGATEEAARRFEQYGLAAVPDEDVAALEARIAKDLALTADGSERSAEAARAAGLYGAVFARTGGYYPAVNAATLWLVAGEAPRSRELAAIVLELLAAEPADSYYAAATEAEARLLLGEEDRARVAVERAAGLHDQDYGALASTRRQLRLICEILDLDATILRALAGPGVVHFCGHRISGDAVEAGVSRGRGLPSPGVCVRLAGKWGGHTLGRGAAREWERAALCLAVCPAGVRQVVGRSRGRRVG